MHGELADDGLAGAGRRGHQHPVPVLERLAGPQLEVVEPERVPVAERGQLRPGPGLPGAGSGVPLGGRGHASRVCAGGRQPAGSTAGSIAEAGAGARTCSAPGTQVARTGSGPDPLAVGVGDDPGRLRASPSRAWWTLDRRVLDVGALVDLREHPQELRLADPAEDRDVEEPVVDPRARADLHAAAVRRAVADRDQHGVALELLAVQRRCVNGTAWKTRSSARIATL